MPKAKRSEAVPAPSTGLAPDAPASLRYDGVMQVLTFRAEGAGDWHLRLELEQLGDGELVGVATLASAALVTAAERGLELVISGHSDRQGLATLELRPVVDDGEGPVTLLVRLTTPPDVADPTVREVLAVKGCIHGRGVACAMPVG